MFRSLSAVKRTSSVSVDRPIPLYIMNWVSAFLDQTLFFIYRRKSQGINSFQTFVLLLNGSKEKKWIKWLKRVFINCMHWPPYFIDLIYLQEYCHLAFGDVKFQV